MTDRTGQDPLAFWLAYLHPLWMLASLSLALLTLRAGLRLRSARRRRARRSRQVYARHLRLAKTTLLMLGIGFAGGLASAIWLRGFGVLGTVHGLVASTTLLLFLATGAVGWRLEHGRSRAVEVHGWLALASVLGAVAAFGTGFVLLP